MPVEVVTTVVEAGGGVSDAGGGDGLNFNRVLGARVCTYANDSTRVQGLSRQPSTCRGSTGRKLPFDENRDARGESGSRRSYARIVASVGRTIDRCRMDFACVPLEQNPRPLRACLALGPDAIANEASAEPAQKPEMYFARAMPRSHGS